MKGIKKHILDFEIIPTGNPKTLVFVDSSYYFAEPERPLLEVTFPGYSNYFLVNVQARKVNTFNSNTLGLTELLNADCLVDLPDGVYTFRYKICPYDKVYTDKLHFRTTQIENRLADLYDKLDASDCEKSTNPALLQEIATITALIEGAKALVEKNTKKANSFYKLASSMLNEALNDLCKSCK